MTANDGDVRAADRGRAAAVTIITAVAILMFVGLASSVLASALRSALGSTEQIDRSLLVALFLNIALILFGWRKHRDLAVEVRVRAAAEARARDLASHDALTGFLNRRSLAEEGARLIAGLRAGQALAMLVVDLDNFKAVNDCHGHAAGDALLRGVADAIGETLPADALAARLGGDEFACAFRFDTRRPEEAEAVAARLVARLARPFDADGRRVHPSASIGVARSDLDGGSIDALMRAADIAMYAAKNSGRGRHAWFDRAMERALQTRHAIETGLRTAIPAGEIVPFFEQQVDLATGRLDGFEVLARWRHPTRGLIGPDQFIAIAEEAGLIGDLSLSLMRQAFVAARDWDQALTLSVNVSPVQLKDAWLAQKVIKALVETGFPASRLEIEITESALFENLQLARSTIGSLKNQGIRIALDDFGTGYSSLAHLRALPFDRIKIDRSFVSSIEDSGDSAAIVTAIARLGDSLSLPVTAEGIETKAIEARLAAIGCTKGQGYLYGRPVDAGEVRRLLAERRLIAAPESSVTSLRRAG